MPNKLPDKFQLIAPSSKAAIGGLSGWIPLPQFANSAHNIGFVDVASVDKVPVYVRYLDRNVISLTLATLQTALGDAPLTIQSGKEVMIGQYRLPIDTTNQISLTNDALDESRDVNKINAISFIDIVDGKISSQVLKDKVIVIGYDGSKMHKVKTRFGESKAHRLFWLGLQDSWRQLQVR
jgi:CHASE2 domain-containing sensor protein